MGLKTGLFSIWNVFLKHSVNGNDILTQIARFMGRTWVLSASVGHHVGPMNLVIGVYSNLFTCMHSLFLTCHAEIVVSTPETFIADTNHRYLTATAGDVAMPIVRPLLVPVPTADSRLQIINSVAIGICYCNLNLAISKFIPMVDILSISCDIRIHSHNWNWCILIQNSLNFVPKRPNDNKSALDQATKALSEPMMFKFTEAYACFSSSTS